MLHTASMPMLACSSAAGGLLQFGSSTAAGGAAQQQQQQSAQQQAQQQGFRHAMNAAMRPVVAAAAGANVRSIEQSGLLVAVPPGMCAVLD
jgi:transcription initiation factor TFIID subunit TAF12